MQCHVANMKSKPSIWHNWCHSKDEIILLLDSKTFISQIQKLLHFNNQYGKERVTNYIIRKCHQNISMLYKYNSMHRNPYIEEL